MNKIYELITYANVYTSNTAVVQNQFEIRPLTTFMIPNERTLLNRTPTIRQVEFGHIFIV